MEWGMDRVPEVFDFFQNVVSSEMATHEPGNEQQEKAKKY